LEIALGSGAAPRGSVRRRAPAIRPSRHLLAVLEEKQTSGDGRVWYGRAVTYRQIASWFGRARPAERTLHRWLAELKRTGQVVLVRERFNQGMHLVIANPRRRFRGASVERSAQLGMFADGRPFVVRNTVQKRVEKVCDSQSTARPRVAQGVGHVCPEKK